MTADSRWLDILARIAPVEPIDLDGAPGAAPDGGDDWPAPDLPVLPPSARLWDRAPGRAAIGIRVDERPADPAAVALRLAAAAVERGVIPVILSSLPATGFESFGFRVERLPEGPPDARALAEAELRGFWDMPIVIDIADVANLG